MSKQKKILLRISIFLIILFSIGVNAYIYLEKQPASIEIFADNKNSEDTFSSDVDCFSFDQIDHSQVSGIVEESQTPISTTGNCFLIRTFSSSVWQPPRIS